MAADAQDVGFASKTPAVAASGLWPGVRRLVALGSVSIAAKAVISIPLHP
jgi:hypothetical protein